ncbi:hypothetical protein CW736_13010 [Nonlabens sp. MB-3u-79]|nr:hypothetical protein CW736_13010 [Nonlabens sp. MB-3u-79]
MPLKQLEKKIHKALSRRLANKLRVDALSKYDLNMSTSLVQDIIVGIFKTVEFAQKNNISSCEKQHKELIVGIKNLNKYIDRLVTISNTNIGDTVDISNALIDTIHAIFTKLDHYGIDLKSSPLNFYFNNIIERLKEITSPENLARASAMNKLKEDSKLVTITTDDNINHQKLKINQIALKYVYEGSTINTDNMDEIAREYGHNSGAKLYQQYNYYNSTANRKGEPKNSTKKKLKNKINLIDSIIKLVDKEYHRKILDECLVLENILKSMD